MSDASFSSTTNSSCQSHRPIEVSEKRTARGPADDYFDTKDPAAWDITDFLEEHKLSHTAEQLSHSWKEALGRVAKATSSTDEMKQKASSLLGKWSVSTPLFLRGHYTMQSGPYSVRGII